MPGGKSKITHEDGNGFENNPQNINRNGRPRKLISSVNKELESKGVKEASAEEIRSCYMRLINMEIEEIEEAVKDKGQPAMIRIVGKNILSGKGFEVIERMLDRATGKAKQVTDITSKDKQITGFVIERMDKKNG